MRPTRLLLLLPVIMCFLSCVSSKRYKGMVNEYDTLRVKYMDLMSKNADCNRENKELTRNLNTSRNDNTELLTQIESQNKQIDSLKASYTAALKQLQDLSALSAAQVDSIRRSMEKIGEKDAYIQELQAALKRKDSLTTALVNNLKNALGNINDKDITIKVDRGVVYIDISDKLLFQSGKYEVNEKAKAMLGKVAQVLKNQSDLEFMVEGHTDSLRYRGEILEDNWDLSVKRATSVVRLLQSQYGLNPAKLAAAGRSEYLPVATNTTAEGRAFNRRTRIVILPQLDQIFKLLES